MDDTELIKVILTSSLIATILSAIISSIVSIRLKNLDYKNEYYKRILEKRLEAYAFLETQIAVMKSSVLDEDGKGYHVIFAYGKDEYIKFQQNLTTALAYGMWINDETVNRMEKLNELFFHLTRKSETGRYDLIELGKENYHQLAKLRNQLEEAIRDYLLNLHDLKAFQKKKGGYHTRMIELKNN